MPEKTTETTEETTTEEGVTYTIVDGTLYVSGEGNYETESWSARFDGVPKWCRQHDEIKKAVIDVKNITNMSNMFYDCDNLESVVFQNIDTANVTDMSDMFNGCSSLMTVQTPKKTGTEVCSLPKTFYDASGKSYDSLPKNATYIITLTDSMPE